MLTLLGLAGSAYTTKKAREYGNTILMVGAAGLTVYLAYQLRKGMK